MAASNKTGRVDKLLVKLKKSVEEKKFYEAHQMYRTLYFRYMAGNRYAEVIDLLYEGATALFENGQHTSGADLALLLVSVLDKTDTEVTTDIIEKLGALYKAFNKQLVECSNFVNQAVKWSARVSGNTLGDPLLHQHFALTLWHEKNYAQARYHFERSNDGERCAMMLIEYHVTMGYPSEVDLFIAQSVLHYLCFKNKLTAEHCFVSYTTNHPMMEPGPPFVRPLLNFLWLLMLAVEGGRLAAFTVLCEQYEPSIARDPCYKEYLDRIGQNFFGLPAPQQAAPSGMFGSLLQSLFESADDDDAETGIPAAAVGAGLDLD